MGNDNPIWNVETARSLKSMITEMSSIENVATKELERLQEHANLLVTQAQQIQSRVELTKKISQIVIPFHIVKEKEYYLYEDDKLSLISSDEWDKGPCITVRQLGDGTWEEIKEIKK